MNNQIIMTIFVVVATVALALQMAILYALYRAMRGTSSRLEGLAARLETKTSPILARTQAILDESHPRISEITSNLAESTATVRAHVAQLGEATTEIVERARLQAERLDDFVGATMSKIELTAEVLQNSVLTPVRRIQAIIQAVSAGLGVLRASRSRKKSEGNSNEADEEMFI